MLVGYARTSTIDQIAGLQAQIDVLRQAGCEKIFREQTSSVGQRQELLRAMEFVREGDVLIVTKLDRLARSVGHLCELVRTLEQKKVALRILDMGLDTATPTGRLMLNLLGSIAQFEREVMLERQRVGIAKAKADGRYKGRKPTARQKAPEIQRLKEAGLSPSVIARQLGISRASVYRNITELGPSL
jgi:DNA invertase Pin-like site-specific DNA recombinase